MPIFYADNPLNVTASSALPVTGAVSVDNAVSVTQGGAFTALVSGTVGIVQSGALAASVSGTVDVGTVANPVTVTASAANPVWITGAINAQTTNPSVQPTGATFPSSASMDGFVSGASNTVVFGRVGTGTMGQALLVTLAQDQSTVGVSGSVSVSNFPASQPVSQDGAWAALVSGVVGIVQSGALAASVSGTVTVDTVTNPVTVTSSFASPVWVTQSQPVLVSTGTFPVVTVTASLASPVSVAISGAISSTISGTVTVTSSFANPVWVTQSQPVSVAQKIPGVGTLSSGTLTTAASQILAANPARLGAVIYNEGSPAILVGLSTTASQNLYTTNVARNATYEIPFGYTGSIWGLSNSGNSTIRITELT